MVSIELSDKQAESVRKWVTLLLDGRPRFGAAKIILDALDEQAVTAPAVALCPHCHRPFKGENMIYSHLRTDHRYPREDAGSLASETWRNR